MDSWRRACAFSGALMCAAAGDVRITHDPAACVLRGVHSRLRACVRPAEGMGRPRAYFRMEGDSSWYSVEMRKDGDCHVAVLPRPEADARRLEYYVFVQGTRPPFAQAQTPVHLAEVRSGEQGCATPFETDAKVRAVPAAGEMRVPRGFSADGLQGLPKPERKMGAAAAALALGVLALGAGLLAGWIGRRLGHRPGPMLSRNLGVALGLVGTAYLALWWRSHAAGAPVGLQLALGVVGVGLVLALTRFGSLAAVAVLSAGGVGDRLPEARDARRHMTRLVAVTLLVLAGAAAAASRRNESEPAGPDYAVRPTGLAVRVIGIDGFDAGLALRMAGRGEMPELARRLEVGTRARLQPEPEQVPAIVWTTIATGRGPESHGIRGAGARRLRGMNAPVTFVGPGESPLAAAADVLRISRTEPPSAVLRTVKTFWNVASEKGLRVGVVNWWATWPAEAVNGYIVSDRTFFKIERGLPADREVHPPDAFATLQGALPPAPDRERRLDLFYAGAAQRLRGATPPDLDAVYLPGLDIFTMQQMAANPRRDLGAADARLALIREYYRFVDRLLGELTVGAGPNDVFLLVGDPGRFDRGGAGGLVVLWGGPVRRADIGAVSARDVAPTVLHLVGLPVSAELEGQVMSEAFDPEFRRRRPIERVARYGRRAPSTAASGFDAEMVEELRSLGYIQ